MQAEEELAVVMGARQRPAAVDEEQQQQHGSEQSGGIGEIPERRQARHGLDQQHKDEGQQAQKRQTHYQCNHAQPSSSAVPSKDGASGGFSQPRPGCVIACLPGALTVVPVRRGPNLERDH
ncbi:hypothetical protein D9M71_816270 [compost metagenome]